jgi:DNA-binding MarR family transcriptional regulator
LIPSVHRATHRIGLYLADEDGLTQGEAHVLAQLATGAPATVGELHRGLAHKRSTLTSILDRLTARGFVTREASPGDRRRVVVRLTSSGRQAARRVYRRLAAIERGVARRVSPDELRACLRVLDALEQEAQER